MDSEFVSLVERYLAFFEKSAESPEQNAVRTGIQVYIHRFREVAALSAQMDARETVERESHHWSDEGKLDPKKMRGKLKTKKGAKFPISVWR